MSKERFVELLVKQGANVQPDQQVLILSEPSCVDLVEMAAEFCYERGARYVDYDVAVPSVALKSATMTVAPRSAQSLAVAWPMPAAPPTTRIVLLCRFIP